ncbi:methyltransferase domain-containing protein [Paenibacillus sp. HWE-109]|uniref:class I SAM-dependent methyltransferase n=1 Tax=Paenibacillus sp. HWE-109 TaxID=1306526 RepID=UPI001EE01CA1|nr:class I SAM-dependent methyltransferase [Paenibacillus sp. HWE-109]UKS29702.1 methyltransferase domain-containing protein [Paenibacillus sp. HWE-109]
MPNNKTEKLHDIWLNSVMDSEDNFIYLLNTMVIRAFYYIDSCMNEESMVLDIGCGTGLITNVMSNISNNVYGVEVDIAKINEAKDRYKKPFFVNGDIQKLPFQDHTFDIITSFSVLQYVDRKTALSEIHRVLKPNGKIVFLENLYGNPFVMLYRMFRPNIENPYLKPKKHIKWSELTEFNHYFKVADLETFHLTTPLSIGIKKIRKANTINTMESNICYNFLQDIDGFLLTYFKFLRKFSWNFVLYGEKPI